MAKAHQSKKSPRFASKGLLVRAKSKVYFIEMAALNEYEVKKLRRTDIRNIAQYFKTIKKGDLVDAAIIPMMHTMEGF